MKLQKILFSPPGKLFLLCFGLALYFIIFIYPLNSLSSKLGYPAISSIFDSDFTLYDFLLSLIFLTPIIGRLNYQIFHSNWSRHLMAICMTWSGFAFFIFFPVLAFDLINIFIQFSNKQLYTISIAILSVSSVIALFGIVNANLLFVKKLIISDKRLKTSSTAIQLSDVHIGSRSHFYIRHLIKKVNKLNADKVFITGDLVDLSSVSEKDLAILKDIVAPVYFVTGNHDRYVSLERLLPLLKKQDFTILRNETIQLEDYDLSGIDDAENPRQVERVIESMQINTARFNILLYHRPQGFEAALNKGINLMLSGHTHNGQIIPFNFLVKKVFKDIKGTKKINGDFLHVSTGTSTWGPIMRIGSTNEITFISLNP